MKAIKSAPIPGKWLSGVIGLLDASGGNFQEEIHFLYFTEFDWYRTLKLDSTQKRPGKFRACLCEWSTYSYEYVFAILPIQ